MELKGLAPVLKAASANDGICGRSMIAKILRGSRDKRLLELGLDQCSEYGMLAAQTLEQIGYLIDEALALGLIGMRDAGWRRGRHRNEAHFPVLFLADRGRRALKKLQPSGLDAEEAPQRSAAQRARRLVMRAMVQGAYALEDHKHHRIEAADFVRESPGAHVVLFAMERHPGGRRLICLYLWDQRTNRVEEIAAEPAWRVSNLESWFEGHLKVRRGQPL